MFELVCPAFYIDTWHIEGRRFSAIDNDPKVEFKSAADDGVCRLLRTERGEFGGTVYVCRCGMKFKAADAKRIGLDGPELGVVSRTP